MIDFQTKRKMGYVFNEAMLALAEANFFSASGNFAANVQEEVKSKSNIRVQVTTTNVAGVVLPQFEQK